MTRDPQSLLFELDYWSKALDDIRALNDLTLKAVESLVELPLELLHVSLTLDPATRRAHLLKSGDLARDAMTTVGEMSDAVGRLVDLATGRGIALRAELDAIQGGSDAG